MKAYIVAAYRTPVGRAKKGCFAALRSDDLAAAVIRHILNKEAYLSGEMVEDIIVGNAVPEAEQGMQMGRLIALLAVGEKAPGMIVNRYCGSGLEAIALASARIHAGLADCLLAGGTESMSMVPMMGYRTAVHHRLATEQPTYFLNMGLTAEEVALKYNITREASDAFAYQSHQRAIRAIAQGAFEEQTVPVVVDDGTTVTNDEGPRPDTSIEALQALHPVFRKGGQVTAGNSSQTSDGAAFVLVVSERFLKQHSLQPIARLCAYAVTGVHPMYMGIGPVEAIPKALKKAGISYQEVAQTELNEAFACQALAVVKAARLDPDGVNVQGGAIALGHPLGCTGAKLSVQLIHALRGQKGGAYGLVTACVGGGQGVAGVYEVYGS